MTPRASAFKRVAGWVAPPLLGVLASLGFAPFNCYPLTLVALVGLLACWWDAGPRRAARQGWWFGAGFFGAGIYWVFVSVHVHGGAPAFVGVFLVALLAATLALFPAFSGLLAGAARGLPRSLWALVLVPAAWLLGELLRATIGTGFPWLSLGYTLTNAPVTALPPLIGVYGLSGLMLVAAGVLLLLFRGGLAARALSVALIVSAPIGLWLLPPAAEWTHADGPPLSVAILQGDVPQDQKWVPGNLQPTENRYRKLAESVNARLVIWPEAAVPSLVMLQHDYLAKIAAFARAHNRTDLVGILVYSPPTKAYYNALLALGHNDGRYYKRHLVPFGEYFPLLGLIKSLLSGVNMRFSSFNFGSDRQTPIMVNGIQLGISICFEDAFPREIRKALPAAGILINVTNDAWFDHSTGPAQHLQIARMRAMEAGRPLLRAANTGISAVIGPYGQVRQRAPHYREATLQALVRPRAGTTPYVRYGNRPLWLLALGLCALGLVIGWLRDRR